MTPCERLSDRMPAVAAGRISWTVEDVAHLDACADCRAEWRLVAAVQRIGPGAASGGDPEGTAAAVLTRVREAEHADRRRATTRRALVWGGLAAAAALMLAVLFGGPARRAPEVATSPASTTSASVAFHLSLPELDGAAPDELQAVLDGLEVPLGESSTLDGEFSGDDVSQQDMERVLRAWEG
jgi:predicted anti-sigma-YlaC factor YlaD